MTQQSHYLTIIFALLLSFTYCLDEIKIFQFEDLNKHHNQDVMDIENEGILNDVNDPYSQLNQILLTSSQRYDPYQRKNQVLDDQLADVEQFFIHAEDPLLNNTKIEPDSETTNIDLNELITLDLKLKKSTLKAVSFMEQVIPMLASIKAGTVKGGPSANVDLVCVIDHSGSMYGEKIELLKKTFHSLLEYLGENDRLSVVAFNNDAISLNPLLRMTAENKAKVLAVIDTLEAKGGTDINRGLSLALSTLSARKYIRVLEDQVFGSNKIKMDM